MRLPLGCMEARIGPLSIRRRRRDSRGVGLSYIRPCLTLPAALLADHVLPSGLPAPLRPLLPHRCCQSAPGCRRELIEPRTAATCGSLVGARPGRLPVALTDLRSLHGILEIRPLPAADGDALGTALLAADIGATRSGVPTVPCGSCLLLEHI